MTQPEAFTDTTDEDLFPQADRGAAHANRVGWRSRAAAALLACAALAAAAAWVFARPAPAGRQTQAGDSVQLVNRDRTLMDRSQWQMGDPNWWNTKCPGQIPIDGLGGEPLKMVNTYYTTPFNQAGAGYAVKDGLASDTVTEGVADTLKVSLAGRSYLADTCEGNDHSDDDDPGVYDDVKYAKLKLLGKRLRYTTNMSRVGCGWDASFALTEMAFNTDPTICKDYYCDAMGTCGAKCVEISLQEANNRAWFSTIHVPNDGQGVGIGYGGDWGEAPRRDWDRKSYGPKSKCIDTSTAFQVAVSFPVGATGQLQSIDVELSQGDCSVSASISGYLARNGTDSMADISRALERGVTPTFSLWASNQMSWLDGKGDDGKGPCKPDMETPRDDVLEDQDFVEWSAFSVEDLPDSAAAPTAKAMPKVKPQGAGKGPDHRKSKSAGH